MSNHTPGPWTTTAKGRDPGCIVIYGPNQRSVATAWDLIGPNGEQPDTPMEANAALIAAAPELHAILVELWSWQAGCQELLPDGLADRIKAVLGGDGTA